MSHCYFISVPVWKYVKFWSKRHNVFKLYEIIRRIYTLICIIGRLSRIEHGLFKPTPKYNQVVGILYFNNIQIFWCVYYKWFSIISQLIFTILELFFKTIFISTYIYPHLANYIYSYEVLFIFLKIYKEF